MSILLSTNIHCLLADGSGPVLDLTYVIQVLSRVLHLLSAMIMVGGLFYLRTILAPSGPEACFADRRSVWARWVGITTFFLLASGVYNLMAVIGQGSTAGGKTGGVRLPPTYHLLLGIKFLLALLVMFVLSMLAGKTKAAREFRNQMQKWLNIAWLAALAIVVLVVVMRTLH